MIQDKNMHKKMRGPDTCRGTKELLKWWDPWQGKHIYTHKERKTNTRVSIKDSGYYDSGSLMKQWSNLDGDFHL